jgi:hypothetical protein
MTDWFPHVPQPPDWRLDWPALEATFPILNALRGCPQDPRITRGETSGHTRGMSARL